MKVKKTQNKIYFKDDEKSFLNISIKENTATLELLRVDERYRNSKLGSKIVSFVLFYIKKYLSHIKSIELSPLPLDKKGLSLESLVKFYEKFGFIKRFGQRSHEPYLMVKAL